MSVLNNWHALLTLFIIVGTLVSLACSAINPASILSAGMSILIITNTITPEQALGGFANPGVITVAVLYIVVAGLSETGAMHWVSQLFFGQSKSLSRILSRLLIPTAVVSVFVNNTPIVAMLTAATQKWVKLSRIPASKLLMPISFATILGGCCSLIGTSTNLVANGLLITKTHQGLHLFTPAWVALPGAIIGLIYLLTIGRYLLPNRQSTVEQLQNPREYTVEILIEHNSPAVGKTIEAAGLRQLPNLYLIEIDRKQQLIPAPSPLEKLQAGDRLIFTGVVDSVLELLEKKGLKLAHDQVFDLNITQDKRCLIEVVLSSSCPVIGKTVKQAEFRSLYGAAIIAISRGGARICKKVGDVVLNPGDTLLLEGSQDFITQQRFSQDFLLVSCLQQARAIQHHRAPVAITILVAMVLIATMGWMDMLSAALLASLAMVLTRCISAANIVKYIDISLFVSIAASFALGQALQQTGLAQTAANQLLSLTGQHPWYTLSLLYMITMIVTEIITNNATVILMFPIAYATSQNLHVNFMPFFIAIIMAASASFLTPIGYQTNLMVYGPGGYQFKDYWRVGAPLSIIIGITVVGLAPIIWPF